MSALRIFAQLAICLALFPVSSAPAQEKLTADEIFFWFPQGEFDSISHNEPPGDSLPLSYQRYLAIVDMPSYQGRISVLPLSLDRESRSTTAVALYLTDQTETVTAGSRQPPTLTVKPLYVYRFDELDSLVEQAVKSGEIDPTGKRAFGRPIYSYSADIQGMREIERKKFFAYATPTQELLVAEELSDIYKMTRAGYGLDPNILDHEDFSELLDLVPELGRLWSATACFKQFRDTLQSMRDKGATEEEIEKTAGKLPGLRWKINAVLLEDEMIKKEIWICSDDDAAQMFFDSEIKTYGESPGYTTNYLDVRQKKTRKTLEDNSVVFTTVYDDELLDSIAEMKKLRQEFERAAEEKNKKHDK